VCACACVCVCCNAHVSFPVDVACDVLDSFVCSSIDGPGCSITRPESEKQKTQDLAQLLGKLLKGQLLKSKGGRAEDISALLDGGGSSSPSSQQDEGAATRSGLNVDDAIANVLQDPQILEQVSGQLREALGDRAQSAEDISALFDGGAVEAYVVGGSGEMEKVSLDNIDALEGTVSPEVLDQLRKISHGSNLAEMERKVRELARTHATKDNAPTATTTTTTTATSREKNANEGDVSTPKAQDPQPPASQDKPQQRHTKDNTDR